jgi:hypothetical protein
MALAVGLLPCAALAQGAPRGQALENVLERQSQAMPRIAAAQAAQYRAANRDARAKWATMTPEQRQATVAASRNRRIKDLTAIERFGQNDDDYLLPI